MPTKNRRFRKRAVYTEKYRLKFHQFFRAEQWAAANRQIGDFAVGNQIHENIFFIGAWANQVDLVMQADLDIVQFIVQFQMGDGFHFRTDNVHAACTGSFQIEAAVVCVRCHHHAAALIHTGGGNDPFNSTQTIDNFI